MLKNSAPATGGKTVGLPFFKRIVTQIDQQIQNPEIGRSPLTRGEQIRGDMGAPGRMTEENYLIDGPGPKSRGRDVLIDPVARQLQVLSASRVLDVRDEAVICDHRHDVVAREEEANICIALSNKGTRHLRCELSF